MKPGAPVSASSIQSTAESIQSVSRIITAARLFNIFAVAGEADQCNFIASWTIRNPLSLVLQLKSIGIETRGARDRGAHNGV
jgi:hypothetical protein